MLKEEILERDVSGKKNPLGVNVELDTASLVRLGLISVTNILFSEEDQSTQKRRLLKILI
jgi:hypothetical protein